MESKSGNLNSINQHIVPQFLLRNFKSGKRPKIWAYDKHTNDVFHTNIRNVAAERRFYDVETPRGYYSVGPTLDALESDAAHVINIVSENKNLSLLTTEQRVILASFAAVQVLRTQARVELQADLSATILEAVSEMMGAEDVKADDVTARHQARVGMVLRLAKTAQEITPYFLDKQWVLYEATAKPGFYIGDNPVTMHNHLPRPNRGNLGLRVPGIEIYLPLSSTLQLGFLCPTVSQMARLSAPSLARLMETGGVIPAAPENVTFKNSLQVWNAARYVYCSGPDFDLAEEMVTSDPTMRNSPKVRGNSSRSTG